MDCGSTTRNVGLTEQTSGVLAGLPCFTYPGPTVPGQGFMAGKQAADSRLQNS